VPDAGPTSVGVTGAFGVTRDVDVADVVELVDAEDVACAVNEAGVVDSGCARGPFSRLGSASASPALTRNGWSPPVFVLCIGLRVLTVDSFRCAVGHSD
jgi:hypothetical protein